MRKNITKNSNKELEQNSLQYYKEEIIRMVKEIQNERKIKMIYGFVKGPDK